MSPTFSRFVSEDPIGIAGGLNLYGYAHSAPSVFTDALGLEPSEAAISAFILVLDFLALALLATGFFLAPEAFVLSGGILMTGAEAAEPFIAAGTLTSAAGGLATLLNEGWNQDTGVAISTNVAGFGFLGLEIAIMADVAQLVYDTLSDALHRQR